MIRVTALVGAATALCAGLALPGSSQAATQRSYVVLYDQGASNAAARAAIEAAGGRVVSVNTAVGLATVRSSSSSFATKAKASRAIKAAAIDRSIGRAERSAKAKDRGIEREARTAAARAAVPAPAPGGDDLSGLQWDMRAIGATPSGSYAVNPGSHAVRVGIIDTGIDGDHPDIARNFNAGLSRNFTVDDPVVDGPCDEDPNFQPLGEDPCKDRADVDEDGHGTHVASTIGAPQNGIGIAGVAPGVELVNLRAGQDSGYFFLQPSVDAITYAADVGIDVVNMSFYIDPWLYNCAANPSDSPAEQAEQRLVIEATQRALTYAHDRGVTLVAAEGNGHTDLGRPTFDDTSPDYPGGTERERAVDNSCLSMPTEGDGVIGVTSVGPSGRKAYYSDYGVEQADISAPGGDFRDFPDDPARYLAVENLILAAYPATLARTATFDDDGDPDTPDVPGVDPVTGAPVDPSIVRSCTGGGRCGYYQYLQGTSMASPHAAGVAALIVAARGRPDPGNGGLTLGSDEVERVLRQTATDTPCPPGGVLLYPDRGPEYTATCEGTTDRNGFYGDGVVNALAAGQPPPVSTLSTTPPAPVPPVTVPSAPVPTATAAAAAALPAPVAAPLKAPAARRKVPKLIARFAAGRTTRVTRLGLFAARGARLSVSCSGGGCPRGSTSATVGGSGARNLVIRFAGRRLRPGARVTVRVVTPGMKTRRFVMLVRSRRAPRVTVAVG